ncbi:membrane protein [Berryella intestinalis]|uniref:Putative manganese efflux pump MntP n=1 Tax=Berryella intestinalis TaxID=1531429 RepID=A0A0A8B966_9ACTN|nr:manganese efflux pump MntP family protein [Berryella intestinalis]AJC11642.1 membrane protein [Berryella intestinalis]
MGVVELLLIAVGLSMDAFAVALCKGLCMKRLDKGQAVVIAAFFGAFQALMPVAGWFLGAQFADAIAPVDHWIVFGLLLFIGGKMIVEAVRGGDGPIECPADPRLDVRELLALAVATSIDALAVGVGFAFLSVDIAPAAALIGCVTFGLSLVGVAVGHAFGSRWERPSMLAGGAVLVAIGTKTLIEHLGYY